MAEIDAEAAGILIENGIDMPTALAGSAIDSPPRVPARPARSNLIFWLAFFASLVAVVAWRRLS